MGFQDTMFLLPEGNVKWRFVDLPRWAAAQPYDYAAANNAVRCRYQIFVGPGNDTESMDYPPFQPLSNYIKEVIHLRKALADTIDAGEFLDILDEPDRIQFLNNIPSRHSRKRMVR